MIPRGVQDAPIGATAQFLAGRNVSGLDAVRDFDRISNRWIFRLTALF
jgi:hypothetical protein